jgi:signal transduction histidine kinase/integral membrane sensor domain MASE1
MYGVSAFQGVGPTTFEAQRLRPLQQATIAAAVAVGYYVGVRIGIGLAFPPTTNTSVLWPPNSILTAALLLLPVRYWWLCLAGALPVHVLLELAAAYPPRTVAALFLTNSLEAVIAAGGVRVFGGAPTAFNTLRSVAVFIGSAVLAAPLLSSFADAAVMASFQGQSYWDVWSVRSFSNSLTALSVVPMVVLGVDALIKRAPLPSPRRLAEIGLLAAGLVWTAVWIFGEARLPGFPPTPSVLVLPFYFWAALRFGVGGLSAALFATVFVATFEARLGHRPFEVLAPAEGLKALQMYLIVMAIPLMCVVGLLGDRRRGEAALHARLKFESVLGKISEAFVRQPLNSAFKESLRYVGEFCDSDYAGLLQIGADGELHVEWQWNRPSGAALLDTKCVAAFPWAFRRVMAGETMIIDGADSFSTEASVDRESFRAAGMHSAIVMPLSAAGRVEGALSLAIMEPGPKREWNLELLQLAAEVLANASARRKAELELDRERQKIASMSRLSSMGELTASLAHQLNQPLTGIRSNAEAAQRFIDSGRATLPQLRDIMLDIVDDNQRASDVIWRVRELLARTEWSPRELDANALVRDVAELIASDALLRNVRVQLDLAPGSMLVRGNRVDLEQVLLNVITNAMDAVAENPVPERMVVMQTACDDGHVHVTVRDRGTGLPDGVAERIFEPFVTTKANGMGMGLAVARSLVDNHGGSIRAANQPGGGAVVTISIPGSSAPS